MPDEPEHFQRFNEDISERKTLNTGQSRNLTSKNLKEAIRVSQTLGGQVDKQSVHSVISHLSGTRSYKPKFRKPDTDLLTQKSKNTNISKSKLAQEPREVKLVSQLDPLKENEENPEEREEEPEEEKAVDDSVIDDQQTQVTRKSQLTALQKQLDEEREARLKLEQELEELRKISSEIQSQIAKSKQ